MIARRLFFVVAAVAIPQLAHSQTHLSAQQFGAAQAVLDFCSKVDSGDKKQFTLLAKDLINGVSAGKLAQDRQSSDYLAAYSTLIGVLGELPAGGGTKACKAITLDGDGARPDRPDSKGRE